MREEIEKAKENKETVVVMTHHAPTFERTSHPKYKGLLWSEKIIFFFVFVFFYFTQISFILLFSLPFLIF